MTLNQQMGKLAFSRINFARKALKDLRHIRVQGSCRPDVVYDLFSPNQFSSNRRLLNRRLSSSSLFDSMNATYTTPSTVLPTSNDQFHDPSDGPGNKYVPRHAAIHEPRRMRLVCIGAGIAGIAAAHRYQQHCENVEFAIYEKNHDVGGTWLENRYPGCACDIPAHGYTYSWEGNPEWSRL